MFLIYCDESNLEQRNDDFFVYGGIAMEANDALELSKTIEKMRSSAGVPTDFLLKFNPSPENLSHPEFNKLKQKVIEAAVQHGCTFFSSLILHDIATSPDDARRNAINTVCYHFDCFLHRKKSHGLVLIDRFNDSQIDAHLREKFSIGVTGLPYSPHMRLDKIIGFHYSAIGQSHYGSVIDIVLGSMRYAVNAFTRNDEDRMSSGIKLLELIAPLFYRPSASGRVSELSLFFSPKGVRSDRYRTKYLALKEFLAENGICAEQPITDVPIY